ncbi:translesion error-prone DNA polymerase V subunit UmuC [Marinobacterium stanieri]|uniref:DNA polymerase V n=1 Tax=Marinobacterium stanieri TaxID=49186 RepID=A0A1N6R3S3_9GAMM|nr:translesion error-prone DNA polymerase V subunit UmuC [Marinobacterium stanieri]SIQ23306.1 DNA polymerase V [Marinobacterium stanieri]
MNPVFALVDCNNFYTSCERRFRPDLAGAPIVVLSNNDGCIISRSAEAKAMGIKMGVPFYQIEPYLTQQGVAVFSSNYALYADMSARVMSILEQESPRVEIYSIDEAFLDLSGMESVATLADFGRHIRTTVQQWTGITVCVGIAPSKTLSKLANHAAKRYPATGGVVDLTSPERQRRLLQLVPVDEVWGVGRRLSKRLYKDGIKTALDLACCHPKTIRQQYSVVLERTVRELNGESCLSLEDVTPTKQQIICSRSFGERITCFQSMREAVCEYTVRAAEKLREEGQTAKRINLFMRTNRHNPAEPQYMPSLGAELPVPTDDTRDLVAAAIRLLRSSWKDGYRYMKAGVMLTDFYEPGVYQPGLFDDAHTRPNAKALMSVLDKINHSGKGQVFLAGQGVQKEWRMKRLHVSPAYTTNWRSLPVVK